jgi:hypothetical protein
VWGQFLQRNYLDGTENSNLFQALHHEISESHLCYKDANAAISLHFLAVAQTRSFVLQDLSAIFLTMS